MCGVVGMRENVEGHAHGGIGEGMIWWKERRVDLKLENK